ncbi:MAG: signal peptidase I [Chloroflexi bacterium]|nr:signal peptidase I [Chloroflexota bacterium]
MTTPEPLPAKRKPALGCLLEIVETLVLTLIIFWIIQSFVAQPYRVQQLSMEQTLEPDQYVLVDKLTPGFDPYKRGDIVVFRPPALWAPGQEQPFIKRVIGIGGDTVEIKDGAVFINGTKLLEGQYVFREDGQTQETLPLGSESRWVVPDGEVFLMGDHRGNSSDSREFGSVAIETVIGRAWLRYWPLDTFTILPTPRHEELATPAP